MPFEIIRNDITRMRVDALVNAANSSLLGGGGVDGAIHRAAGPELLEECRRLNGCGTGQAKITGAYRLPCRYVIHTVGPVWQGGHYGEKELLASCYRESLRLAADNGCASVAFPLISSGAYGYPKEEALRVAEETIRAFLESEELMVYLVVYGSEAFALSREKHRHIQAFIDDSYIGPEFEENQRRRFWQARRADICYSEALSALPDIPDGAKAAAPRPKKTDGVMAAASLPEESLSDYLKRMDEGFRDMLLRKIAERGITDADCYKGANMDRKLFSKIRNQADYHPGKSTVLALAVSLRLDLPETEELLRKAGFALSDSSIFDLIVKFHILHGDYDIYSINEALFDFDQKLLGSLN